MYGPLSIIYLTTDVNECSDDDLNACDREGICTNNDGSYTCKCETGYAGNGFKCEGENYCY